MLDKLDAALRFQQEALNLRAQRQEVLAANIANADTPGYQARDIDFASELKKVMQRGRDATSVVALTMTSTQHIPAQALTPPTVFRTSLRLTVIPSIWIANAPSLPITACNTR
jgi:flagellar basal-body rod protein FlgB